MTHKPVSFWMLILLRFPPTSWCVKSILLVSEKHCYVRDDLLTRCRLNGFYQGWCRIIWSWMLWPIRRIRHVWILLNWVLPLREEAAVDLKRVPCPFSPVSILTAPRQRWTAKAPPPRSNPARVWVPTDPADLLLEDSLINHFQAYDRRKFKNRSPPFVSSLLSSIVFDVEKCNLSIFI